MSSRGQSVDNNRLGLRSSGYCEPSPVSLPHSNDDMLSSSMSSFSEESSVSSSLDDPFDEQPQNTDSSLDFLEGLGDMHPSEDDDLLESIDSILDHSIIDLLEGSPQEVQTEEPPVSRCNTNVPVVSIKKEFEGFPEQVIDPSQQGFFNPVVNVADEDKDDVSLEQLQLFPDLL